MNKFKINNIYNDSGKTLYEIVNNYLLNFLDNELNYMDSNDVIINN